MEQTVGKQLDKKKIVLIVVAIVSAVLALLAGIYIYISIHFTEHFYSGSKIGEVDVSGMTAAEADDALQQLLEDYQLTIHKKDGTRESITADEIQLAFKWSVSPADYLEQQTGYEWLIKVFQPDIHEMQGTIWFDEVRLNEKIANLEAMKAENQIAAIDATVSAYDEKEGYTLVPAVPGTEINVDVFTSAIKDCIYALKDSLDMTQGGIYVEPKIKDDNVALLTAISQLNTCLKTKITYKVGGQTQVLDATTFQKWLSLNENLEVVVDDNALTTYVNGLASKYNTYYAPKKFMTSYEKEITITNSRYGWSINSAAEKEAIVAEIMAGKPVTRDLHYSSKARNRGAQEFGNSYVEINLTAQHLFLYVDGQLILESDLISGNVSKGWDTPPGIFGLSYKTTNATLRGADYVALVSYWMPFNGNVGMHDATYKDDFGKDYYLTEGSHGCINLPLESAKTIYAYVYANFPVIVYKLPGTEWVETVEE